MIPSPKCQECGPPSTMMLKFATAVKGPAGEEARSSPVQCGVLQRGVSVRGVRARAAVPLLAPGSGGTQHAVALLLHVVPFVHPVTAGVEPSPHPMCAIAYFPPPSCTTVGLWANVVRTGASCATTANGPSAAEPTAWVICELARHVERPQCSTNCAAYICHTPDAASSTTPPPQLEAFAIRRPDATRAGFSRSVSHCTPSQSGGQRHEPDTHAPP